MCIFLNRNFTLKRLAVPFNDVTAAMKINFEKTEAALQKVFDTCYSVTESVIEEIRRRRRFSWFGHISRMEIDRLLARALYCHVTGERSQRAHAKKWIENIKEDFELRNIQLKDAVASCKDRTAWRQLISSTSLSSWWRTRKEEDSDNF